MSRREKLTFRCPKSFFPQGEIANLGPFRFFFAGPCWGSVPGIPSRGCGVLFAPFDPLRGCGVLVAPWIPSRGCGCLGCSLDPLRGCGVLAAPFNRGKCPGQEKLTFRCPKSFFPQGEIANLGPFRFFLRDPLGARFLGSPPGGAVSWLLLSTGENVQDRKN